MGPQVYGDKAGRHSIWHIFRGVWSGIGTGGKKEAVTQLSKKVAGVRGQDREKSGQARTQRELAARVVREDRLGEPRLLGGLDCAAPRDPEARIVAAAVVLRRLAITGIFADSDTGHIRGPGGTPFSRERKVKTEAVPQ